MSAMTESEWLRCGDPMRMLKEVRAESSGREGLLLAAACCARVWESLPENCRKWARLAEDAAEGRADPAQLDATWEGVESALGVLCYNEFPNHAEGKFAALLEVLCVYWDSLDPLTDPNPKSRSYTAERKAYAALVRDIFGNPFREASIDPACLAWNDCTVSRIARAIYDERAFERMPILADALEDAGCDNADILNHCRGSGVHVRGCWVVDLLLGKK
jgi:hypothetical protein